ncbi:MULTISPECIES: PTS sugar transporter subunit IIB [Coprobacillaceae]|uniref:PTS sugar transporter subunit IIB n=1 Tax=Coprobacillaceae TaxID=2810280 RepID=UPI000E481DF3|nr:MULTISPECIES: PTS sugar transporter subunit IIB [Coprobacillaceae]RHM61525.1 PTS sugar transporter subunit IIB [Coprobacillus sp. AF33-1AC]RHS91212.1 PTS sugar transporter subunit IIB [Erysipelatoclostridium sp. AM42-17]
MVKIMLACSAGMSTSLLVTRMQKEAEKRGLDAKIWAVSESQLLSEYEADPADVILIGPQVRFRLNGIREQVKNAIPVDVIDMRTYGMMDGGKVLDQGLKMIEDFKK